eukprot:763583-Hanusia_phi.AAC.3
MDGLILPVLCEYSSDPLRFLSDPSLLTAADENSICRICRKRVLERDQKEHVKKAQEVKIWEQEQTQRDEQEWKDREERERREREDWELKERKEQQQREREESQRKEKEQQETTSREQQEQKTTVHQAALKLQLGDIQSVDFQHFSNLQQIGSGSFKLVYKARWKQGHRSDSDVAILLIRGSASTGRKGEFEQEVRIFQHLGIHPNLLRLLAVTTEPDSGDHCLVTEFAPKGSLDGILSILADGELTISLLVQLQVARQICDGMVQLSLHDVVHRDLSARNVLVFSLHANDHLGVSVKIADYGLSVLASRGYGESRGSGVSTAGATARPVRWMAPESIRRRQYSEQSDVWAFGVTLWEVWTYAELPYGAITDDMLVGSKVLEGARLSTPPSCPAGVYGIMQKCWKEKKMERPTFSELQKLLQEQYDEAVEERARARAQEGQVCVVCMEGIAEWALVPCGHKCLCEGCKEGASARACPMCRSYPTSVYKIY